MSHADSPPASALASTRAAAREQINHLLDRYFDETDAVLTSTRQSARRELSEFLNNAARRMRQAETRDVWTATLVEAAASFCSRAALLGLTSGTLKLERASGVELSVPVEVTVDSAPAFANALQSKDTVIAAATPGELSAAITDALGNSDAKRVYLFPLLSGERAFGVMYAGEASDPVDVSALELLVALGASSIPQAASAARKADLVLISGTAKPVKASAPSWAELPRSERELHLRAQRFARSKVAELVLRKAEQVRQGRASSDLYGTLRSEIDAGRDAFRKQFMENTPSGVDYFHLELLRTLAQEDADALGPEYPGPLL